MHIKHLHKIITTDLKPAYYFKFNQPTGELTMRVLEFNTRHGSIHKQSVFPYTYFGDENKVNQRQAFLTKRKYKLFMKRLKAT
jgi:hypothetical protein